MRRKKVILVVVLLEIFLIGFYVMFSHIRYDTYKHCYVLKSFNGFTYEMYSDHAVVSDYSKNSSHVTIPDKFLGKPVTTIGSKAFLYLPVESVTLGQNVETIEDDAFAACVNLKYVDGKANLINLGQCAFMGCSSLESISIGDSLSYLGQDAFWIALV